LEKTQGVKKKVLEDIFDVTVRLGNPVFDNELVKDISRKHGFKNPFDATKLDDLSRFPKVMLDEDYFIVHIGQGRHKFIKGISKAFHEFENITEENQYPWKYRKSILNELDSSEANILSVANNQRILHDFLYEDIIANPKVYNSRRTQISFKYNIDKEEVISDNVQIETDLTLEYQGVVTVIEGKNNFPKNFAVYQIYHPFLYYIEMQKKSEHRERLSAIKQINCCYVLRKKVNNITILRLYSYRFINPYDMTSLELMKSAEYSLVKR
jgi:hypothetical protein